MEGAREAAWDAAEAEEMRLWLASGKSKRAFRKYLETTDDALYATAIKLWLASGKSEKSFDSPDGDEEPVEVNDGYGEDAPDSEVTTAQSREGRG